MMADSPPNISTLAPEELLGPLNDVEQRYAPKTLHVAGIQTFPLPKPRVAIVGSRKASSNAIKNCHLNCQDPSEEWGHRCQRLGRRHRHSGPRGRHRKSRTYNSGTGDSAGPDLPGQEPCPPTGNHETPLGSISIPIRPSNHAKRLRPTKPDHGSNCQRINHY